MSFADSSQPYTSLSMVSQHLLHLPYCNSILTSQNLRSYSAAAHQAMFPSLYIHAVAQSVYILSRAHVLKWAAVHWAGLHILSRFRYRTFPILYWERKAQYYRIHCAHIVQHLHLSNVTPTMPFHSSYTAYRASMGTLHLSIGPRDTIRIAHDIRPMLGPLRNISMDTREVSYIRGKPCSVFPTFLFISATLLPVPFITTVIISRSVCPHSFLPAKCTHFFLPCVRVIVLVFMGQQV